MKKFLLLIVIFLAFGSIWYLAVNKDKTVNDERSYLPISTPAPTISQSNIPVTTSIFVPYWQDFTEPLDFANYDRLIYFGVNAVKNGIDFNEQGYKNLASFMSNESTNNKDVWLAVRMLNDATTESILDCARCGEKVAEETVDVVNKYGMKGIVLDLEITAIPLTAVEDQITNFVKVFYTYSKGHNVKVAMTIYGDTFYRKRPFNISALNQLTDEWYVMAYDFHKSRGEPGPNFPLEKGTKYDYDFKTMINDFLQFSEAQKINVVFGMYGYDWIVDEKERPLRPATSLSDVDIKTQYIDQCDPTKCIKQRDEFSGETEIDIVADNSLKKTEENLISVYPHIIWYEDLDSVAKKKDYLEQKGIGNVAYWAYGYF